MRTKFVVSIVSLLAVVMAGMSANADPIISGVSFSAWSNRTTEAHAGVTQLVTFSDTPGGQVTAFYKNGFLVCPVDRYGVFSDVQYIRIDQKVLGIEVRFIRDVKTTVDDRAGISVDGDSVVVSVRSLSPDLYSIVTSVTQNQGRVDKSGLLPMVLQLFGQKKHHQITATDTVAAVFGIVDASRYVEMFCHYQLGISDPSTMDDEQRYICKSVYFDSRLKGVLEFTEAVADYSWLSQGLSLKLQSMNPPLATPSGPDPVTQELQTQNDELRKQFADLQKQVEEINSKPVESAPVVSAPAPSIVAPMRQIEVMPAAAQNAGKSSVKFVLSEGSRQSVTKTIWKWNGTKWFRCGSFEIRPNQPSTWFFDPAEEIGAGWKGFGLSNDGKTKPTIMYPIVSGANSVEVER